MLGPAEWLGSYQGDSVQKFLQIIEDGCKLKENISALKRPALEKWMDALGSETVGGDSRQELSV